MLEVAAGRGIPNEYLDMIDKSSSGGDMTFILKVDVIIAAYNAESTIKEAIRSLMDQIIPPEWWQTGLTNNDNDNNDNDNENENDLIDSNNNQEEDMYEFDICVCCYDDASTDGTLLVVGHAKTPGRV